LKYIRLIWILLNLFVSTIGIGLLIITFGWLDSQKKYVGKLPRLWGIWFLYISGIKYTIKGIENIDSTKQYIFVSNHESHIDIPLTVAIIPFNLVFLAKKELFKIPIFGWAMRSAGMVRVDRQDRVKAKQSVDYALKQLQNTCVSVILFPEGTRSKTNDLLPFKKGGFILAIRSKLPIVPITIIDSRKVLPKGKLFIKPHNIHIYIGNPISVDKLIEDDKDILLDNCRTQIQTCKNKAMS